MSAPARVVDFPEVPTFDDPSKQCETERRFGYNSNRDRVS